MEGNVNVKDLLINAVEEEKATEDYTLNDDISLEEALKELKNVNNENFGGNETMNAKVYDAAPVDPVSNSTLGTNYAILNDKTEEFVNRNVVNTDDCYRRITILKRTLDDLKQQINSTNCANMDSTLAEAYNCIASSIKSCIAIETIGIENGEYRPW